MKVVSTEGLTKLIQLVKSAFIKVEDVVETQEVTLADVATSGSYNDLSDKPTIPDTSNLANKDLSNLSSTGNAKFQAPLVSGTNIKTLNGNSILGSGDITIQSAPDIDEISITTNSNDELQTVGVIDQNNTTNAIKTWTGTKAQYDAIVTKDSNTLYWVTDSKIIYSGNNAVGNFSGGRNVGEIISSTLPLTDAGLHLLDGTRLSGDGIYGEFVQYIADLYAENPSANYFCTESDWQANITQYGVCGKFVYDSTNNTVRLPKVTGKIDGTTDLSALGDLEPLFVRLPNMTGYFGSQNASGTLNSADGTLFSLNNVESLRSPGTSKEWYPYSKQVNFDASRASSVYSGNGSDTAIHEQAIKCFVYIVIANSTKTDIQSDIDEIVTDLNGKADTDLSNLTNGLSNTICITKPTTTSSASSERPAVVTQNYVNGTSWYRVYSDGWCEQGGFVNNNTAIKQITLLKSYSNTNYSVVALSKYSRTDTTLYQPHADGFTNSSFYLASYGERGGATNTNGEPVLWRACGYIN